MYSALAKHSGMSLTMKCTGDTWIDDHHTADKYHSPEVLLQTNEPSHRTALLPLAQPSSKLWERFVGFADMGQVSRRSMKYGKSLLLSVPVC